MSHPITQKSIAICTSSHENWYQVRKRSFNIRLLCFQRKIQTLELHTIRMSSAWLKTGLPGWSWPNGTQTSFGISQHCPTCPRLERRSSGRRHCSGDMTLKKSWPERRSSELACWRGKQFQTLWIRCALSLIYFLSIQTFQLLSFLHGHVQALNYTLFYLDISTRYIIDWLSKIPLC